MKHSHRLSVLTVIFAAVLSFALLPALAEDLVAEEDTASTYTPTNIVNGDFSQAPWMNYYVNGTLYDGITKWDFTGTASSTVKNGVDEGWNTTTLIVQVGDCYDYQNNTIANGYFVEDGTGRHIFNWQPSHHGMNTQMSAATLNERGGFIECNGGEAATLYQDLTTNGGDIIRWSFLHGVRYDKWASDIQPMTVFVGAPDGTPTNTDPKITAATKAKYYSTNGADGHAEGEGRAFGNTDELKYLYLTKSANATKFYETAGIYIVPDGQKVTRFAFQSNAVMPNGGNWMDDVEFSTLIGNLKAVGNTDGSVTVTGYWGDTDTAKKLVIAIGSEKKTVDMKAVCNKNFKVNIPKETIGTATEVGVYHQDYDVAQRKVKLEHKHVWTYSASGATLSAWCSNPSFSEKCPCQGEAKALKLTVTAVSTVYSGEPVEATLSDTTAWKALLPVPSIEYYRTGDAPEKALQSGTSNKDPLPGAPSDPGAYSAEITAESKTAAAAFIISKTGTDAPEGLTCKRESKPGAGDGAIYGVDEKMEYTNDGGKTWTSVPKGQTELTGLSGGKYLVRYAATPTASASPAVKLDLTSPVVPKTGDENPLLLFAALLLMSAAACGVMLRRRAR